MKQPLPVSMELLNAFVDNELDAEARERILLLEATNPDVRQAICELHRLKTQVKAARPTEDFSDTHIVIRGSKRSSHGYAAAAAVLAFLLMIVMFRPSAEREVLVYAQHSTYPDTASLMTAVAREKKLNLVLHLNSADLKAMSHTVDLIDSVLALSAHNHHQLDIEVIASGPGIKLLLLGDTDYLNRIEDLRHRYSNLTLIACQETLKKMFEKSGRKLETLQGVQVVSSGPLWAKQRRQQGWAYVRI